MEVEIVFLCLDFTSVLASIYFARCLRKYGHNLDKTQKLLFWNVVLASLAQVILSYTLSISACMFSLTTIFTEILSFCTLAFLSLQLAYAKHLKIDPISNFLCVITPWMAALFWVFGHKILVTQFRSVYDGIVCVLHWGSENKGMRIYTIGVILFGFLLPILFIVRSHFKGKDLTSPFFERAVTHVQANDDGEIVENNTPDNETEVNTVFLLTRVLKIACVRVAQTHMYSVIVVLQRLGVASCLITDNLTALALLLMMSSYTLVPILLALELRKLNTHYKKLLVKKRK